MGKTTLAKEPLFNKDPKKIRVTIDLDLNDKEVKKIITFVAVLAEGNDMNLDGFSFRSLNAQWVGRTAFEKLCNLINDYEIP